MKPAPVNVWSSAVQVFSGARSWDASQHLRINSGVSFSRDSRRQPSSIATTELVLAPCPDWRPLTNQEHQAAVTTQPPPYGVHVIDVPDSLMRLSASLLPAARAPRHARDNHLDNSLLEHIVPATCTWLLEEIAYPFDLEHATLTVDHVDVARPLDDGLAGVRLARAGRAGTRRATRSRAARGVGMGINLGSSDRHFCFLPTPPPAANSAASSARLALAEWIEADPKRPLLQVTLAPGQAVIAPVYDILSAFVASDSLSPLLYLSSARIVLRLTSSHRSRDPQPAGSPTRAQARAGTNTGEDSARVRVARNGGNPRESAVVPSIDLLPEEPMWGPLKLAIMQPTPFCNIDCDYCYLPNRQSTKRMSFDALEIICRRLRDSGLCASGFTMCWHAGEPLVVGCDFYERAFTLVTQTFGDECRVTQSVQTNGLLVDTRWCDLFRRHAVNVGLSLDGPAFLHDAHRTSRRGHPTHAKAYRALRLLQDAGVSVSVIAVVTAATLPYPDEFFSFFVSAGIRYLGINIDELEGAHLTSSLQSETLDDQYRCFLERVFVLSRQHPELVVREFSNMEHFLLGGMPVYSALAMPYQHLAIDCDGNVATFSPELLGVPTKDYDGSFALGNLVTEDLTSPRVAARLRRMYHDVRLGVDRCQQTCSYYSVCGGGSPSNKYFENGTFASAETRECRLTKQVLAEVVLDGLAAELTATNAKRQTRTA